MLPWLLEESILNFWSLGPILNIIGDIGHRLGSMLQSNELRADEQPQPQAFVVLVVVVEGEEGLAYLIDLPLADAYAVILDRDVDDVIQGALHP